MNIDDVLEMIDDTLDKGATVPFSGKKVVVDADKIRDLLNEIRLNLPSEIKQAKLIVMDRKTIISDANNEAEAIVRKAEERAKAIVSNDEIVKEARAKANEILNQTQDKCKQMKIEAREYVENILDQTEGLLSASIVSVKKTKQAVRTASKSTIE
ncbi:MAG: ATPase [Oscillospiraceae bacterium]